MNECLKTPQHTKINCLLGVKQTIFKLSIDKILILLTQDEHTLTDEN